MSKQEFYVQCDLRRLTGAIQVTWLPERYAQIGKFLKLLNKDTGKWENGWKVLKTYSKLPSGQVEGCERDYLHQRECSDV